MVVFISTASYYQLNYGSVGVREYWSFEQISGRGRKIKYRLIKHYDYRLILWNCKLYKAPHIEHPCMPENAFSNTPTRHNSSASRALPELKLKKLSISHLYA